MTILVHSTSITFAFLLLLSLQLLLVVNVSLACKCIPPSLNVSLFENPDAIVIAGRIMNELKLATPTPDETNNRYFTMNVRQVYKSCSIEKNDTIMITTRSSSAACGVNLVPNTGYLLTAFKVPTTDNGVYTVSVMACDYNSELPITDENVKQTLQQFRSNLDNSQYLNCPSTNTATTVPCKTGADCDQKSEYCDAINNACIVIDAPCPTPPGTVNCLVAPCTITDPCQTQDAVVGPITCIDNYCGGCNAIFIDGNRTQICNGGSSS